MPMYELAKVSLNNKKEMNCVHLNDEVVILKETPSHRMRTLNLLKATFSLLDSCEQTVLGSMLTTF